MRERDRSREIYIVYEREIYSIRGRERDDILYEKERDSIMRESIRKSILDSMDEEKESA